MQHQRTAYPLQMIRQKDHQLPPKDRLYLANVEMVKTNGPYSHFFTVTFADTVYDGRKHDLYSQLIRQLNTRFFGKHRAKRGVHIKGFCFIEQQINEGIHFHTLVQHNDVFYVPGKPTFRTHFIKEAEALFATPARGKRNLASYKGLDCQPVHPKDDINKSNEFYLEGEGDWLLHYCLAETKRNQELCTNSSIFTRINVLGPEGISGKAN